ncbi:solanesyl diphosphate synthase 3, chloroplastic/mitochondrial [Eucalyptus grandis]|uniref:solanesyl diphosphate synthase 3, chloroplastic/mitochondrial n=1 Tax=Eucalyptus grandis TaxID=71139 RepID=UPI00192EBCD5|nr:solanesyl diphosphate synthase 3, chloroplastic/mitochondrial [Eucalyptus grandis]
MASALHMPLPEPTDGSVGDAVSLELCTRQQCIAEITEMIHVASLLHDDVLDDADTRRGIGSLNFIMGNKLAVLAGDFLLSRACVALASLKNTEVVSLLATIVEHLLCPLKNPGDVAKNLQRKSAIVIDVGARWPQDVSFCKFPIKVIVHGEKTCT